LQVFRVRVAERVGEGLPGGLGKLKQKSGWRTWKLRTKERHKISYSVGMTE